MADVERFELRDPRAGARVEIAPERGGLVTRFDVNGDPALFLDEATLTDPGKNVRGGIPILFPIAGRLPGDLWVAGATEREMRPHGFARNRPWRVTGKGFARIAMELSDDAETRAAFPFAFRLDLGVSVSGRTLRLELSVENRSAAPMPIHAGFHPYFFVPDASKREARIPTPATRAWDNLARAEVPVAGVDLARAEVDLHLLDHGPSHIRLERPAPLPAIRVDASPEFGAWVIWTLAGRDFVCVEPWTAPAGALATGAGLLFVEPGGSRRLSVAMTVEAEEA